MKTITNKQLINYLKTFDENTKIYLSCDSEGNSFSTISLPESIEYIKEKSIITIFPWQEGIDWDELK